jgi:hypothetical protein
MGWALLGCAREERGKGSWAAGPKQGGAPFFLCKTFFLILFANLFKTFENKLK